MSTKFEQLLDLLVNEEHEKANELFHEIVVETSRNIYENLIAEEAEEEEMDEAADEEADESVDEAADEEADESVEESADEEEMDEAADEELEDSYMMDGEEGDATDDFGAEIGADGEEGEEGGEGAEDKAIFDIKNAIQELEAAFAELEQAQGNEMPHDEFGDEEGGEEGEDEMMGQPAFEGKRVTREYVEKVGNDWDKNSMKSQGQYVGAGTGDKDGAPVEGKSPISSGKGKPTTGATAANLLKGATESGSNTGTSPQGKAGGFLSNPKVDNAGNVNVPGGKVSVKGLKKEPGHGPEKKGTNPGPVGAGTGDKAGQTSIAPETKKQFLPQFGKK
jgi:hypothetical protein